MVHPQPAFDDFRGFDKARTILWCHEARHRVHAGLSQTDYLSDEAVCSVHVDNTTRGDRCFLTAFDVGGRKIGGLTLYVDVPEQRLDIVPEFDHDFTNMPVPDDSDLASIVEGESGWVIDVDALRRYDPLQDRRDTQRGVLIAHLADMTADGRIRGSFRPGSDDVEPGESGSSAA